MSRARTVDVNCFACGDVVAVPAWSSQEQRERAKCLSCRNADQDADAEDFDYEEVWG